MDNKMYVRMEIKFDEDTGRLQIGDRDVFVRVFEPGQEVFDETLDQYHQFPGVATDVVFPQVDTGATVSVHTAAGAYSGPLTASCFNYHVCNKRFVFGVLPALEVPADVSPHLRVGAPILCNEQLVSVVTAVHERADGVWLVPVTGVRGPHQVSGHARVCNGVRAERLRAGRSVYGAVQLPYDKLKTHALSQTAPHAEASESCALFYNDSEVRITFNKGSFELMHWRLPGPFVATALNKHY
ncbi:p26 [Antheraea pernyi nucleopolyhedrovirus]|uniref:p26 n=2 Tax=Antheraea pernyi nuclear polyhedrosis virus TaxID=161494 RepID=Q80IN6_NPVAP|nr:p26 [Antheraea pernyi nucleopolyhedrovirus]AWD33541.1 P26 [Antheraea proylei nucleopolyhedrovirus]BBD50476.1 P26 [Antheraea yamamai nucleopolyhedrovirus]BBD50628.1 P26 [Samia cynthia nucleopolyhedrovirus]ABF50262.1 p26 [Antheraea pernyi nucleopolyhedrovirus]ABQ12250.1 P26 [Antheraea pernyi nucleopolyhedrovirus]